MRKIAVVMNMDTDNSWVRDFTIPKVRQRYVDDFCAECKCNAKCDECVLGLFGVEEVSDEKC